MKIYKIIPVLFLLFVHNAGLLADELFETPTETPNEYYGKLPNNDKSESTETYCTWDYGTNFTYSVTLNNQDTNIVTKAYIYYYNANNEMTWQEAETSNELVTETNLEDATAPSIKLNPKKLKSSSNFYVLFISYIKDKDTKNLIKNPGFEDTWDPNGIPSSQYDWKEPGTNGLEAVQGTYTIDNTIDRNNTTSTGCSQDHTSINSGTGGMFFMANGHSNKETFVWLQSFDPSPTLSANKYYAFSAWAMNWATNGHSNSPKLQFYINTNDKLGDRMDVKDGDQCTWKQISAIKKMSSETSITQLFLRNEETSGSGNDFALDDLYFGEVKKVYQLYTIEIGKYFEPEVISVALCPTLLTTKTIDGVKDYIARKLNLVTDDSKTLLDTKDNFGENMEFEYKITDTDCSYTAKIIKVKYSDVPDKTWKDRTPNQQNP